MRFDTQEMFNQAAIGLLKQGTESIVNGNCVYRGENGRKCGVGFVIPDNLYNPEMEGWDASHIPEVCDEIEWTSEQMEMLTCIQLIHDDITVKYWEEKLHDLADHYALEFPNISAAANNEQPTNVSC